MIERTCGFFNVLHGCVVLLSLKGLDMAAGKINDQKQEWQDRQPDDPGHENVKRPCFVSPLPSSCAFSFQSHQKQPALWRFRPNYFNQELKPTKPERLRPDQGTAKALSQRP